MKRLDFNLLLALEALLDEASVSRAAVRLHLSTPAMSHTLARLREAVGDPLLVRAGRVLVPTPRAQALREPVRQLMRQARSLVDQVHAPFDLAAVERRFVLRAPDGMAVVHGAKLLAAIRRPMPKASLCFVAEGWGNAQSLREGEVDFDITGTAVRLRELESAPLFTQKQVGVMRARHPLAAGRMTLKRYLEAEHVAVMPRAELSDEQGSAAVGDRRIGLVVPSAYAALMAVSASDLLATVPDRLARASGKALGLQVFALPMAVEAESVRLVWHPRMAADAAHLSARQAVREVLERS